MVKGMGEDPNALIFDKVPSYRMVDIRKKRSWPSLLRRLHSPVLENIRVGECGREQRVTVITFGAY